VRDHQDGQAVIDDHCAQHAEHLVADLKAGKPIFTGTVKSNTGKLITGKDTGLYDPSLETTDYLVEGIVGTV